jgi:hypothetical protein
MPESTTSPEPEHPFFEVFFSNSFDILTARIRQSQNQVISCVDAVCPPAWFKLMLACRRRGLEVTLIVPAIELNTRSGLAWERLVASGVQLVWLEAQQTCIKTSVCVIDQSVVVSGCFDDKKSVAELVFSGIVVQNAPHAVAACLEGLKQLLPSKTGAVDLPLSTLKKTPTSPPSTQLIPSADPVAKVLAWQLSLLADHSLALHEEIADMHRKINTFDSQQEDAIGSFVRQYLDLKQRYLTQLYQYSESEQEQGQAQSARTYFAQFQSRDSIQIQPPPAEPPGLQQQEDIKNLYRKLVMLCHPDRVQAEHKLQAQELFQQVQTSYRNFDVSVLKNIEQQLQQVPLGSHNTAPDALDSLIQRLADVEERLTSQCAARRLILQNPTWQTLSSQNNWDVWFAQQAHYLQAEIQRYSLALEATAQPAP